MFRSILFFLILMSTIVTASPSVAILSTQGDNHYLARTIRQKLSPVLSADIFVIKNTFDISKIISRKPDLIILLSDKTAETYLKYGQKNSSSIPVVAICNYDSYEKLAPKIKNGIVIVRATSSTDLFQQVSKFTGNLYPSVGYLYPDSLKEKTIFEMHHLKLSGITPFFQKMQEKPTPELIMSSLEKLIEKGATVIRIAGSGETLHMISNERQIRDFLAKNTSVIISDKQDLNHSLPGSIVVTLRENRELLSSVVALITQAVHRSNQTETDFTVTIDIASLHYGKVKHFSLMDHKPHLLETIDKAIISTDTINSRSAIWSLVNETLKSLAVTGVGIPADEHKYYEDKAHGLDQKIFRNISIRDLILLVGTTLLIIVIINSFIRKYRHLIANQATALLYPRTVLKRVLSNPNGRNRKITNYLKREKYRSITSHSLTHYRRQLKSINICVHIIDWEIAEDAVHFLHNIMRDRTDPIKDIVIVFNISKKEQLEITPRFGDIALHLYEKFPTTEECDNIFYGSGKQEHNVSYISGILAEDSLPPIFQMLETNKVNGALLIEDPKPFAAIFYRDGSIVYAEDRLGKIGENSLFNSLSKQNGTFRFERGQRSPVENISVRSMDLLMRWATKADELAR